MTAEDLRRCATGPWCPKCGTIFAPGGPWPAAFCPCGEEIARTKPGLSERMPETMPGIRWTKFIKRWAWVSRLGKELTPHDAADLWLGCVVRVVPGFRVAKIGDFYHVWIGSTSLTTCPKGVAPTEVEATAIACHRHRDVLDAAA